MKIDYRYTPFAFALCWAVCMALLPARLMGQGCFTGWQHNSPLTITNAGSALSNQQVKLTINTASLVAAGQMQADGDDIRFSLQNDCCTPLCYWIEKGMNTASTDIWVKLPNIPSGTLTINLLHGNASASAGKDGTCTFEFFDDFSGNALNTSKWSVQGAPSTNIVNGDSLIFAGNNNWEYIASTTTFNSPVMVHSRQHNLNSGAVSFGLMSGFAGTHNRYVHRFGNGTLLGTTFDNDLSGGNAWSDQNYPNVPGAYTTFENYEVVLGLNGSNQIEYTSFCNTTQASCNTTPHTFTEASGSAFHLGYCSYSNSYAGVVDHIFVTKYTSNMPSASLGAMMAWAPGNFNLPNIAGYCQSDSVLLDAGSGFNTYSWSTGANTPGIYVSLPGSYHVTVTSGGCILTDTAIVVAHAPVLPSLNYGDTAICGSVNLVLDAGAGYSSYLWQNGDTTQTSSATGYGVYSVVVTESNGCTGTDTMTISQGMMASPPSITIIGSQPACTGDTVILDAGAGYTTYNWGVSTSQSLTVTQSGTYIVTVTDGSGCVGTDTAAIVISSPTNIFVIVSGGMVSAIPLGFSSYQWLLNGQPIPGANSSTYNATISGDYSVIVTDSNGCSATSAASPVVGMRDVLTQGFTVSPNPTAGDFRIQLAADVVEGSAVLEIHDLQGRLLHSRMVQGQGRSMELSLQGVLPTAGTYLVSLKAGDKVYRASVVRY